MANMEELMALFGNTQAPGAEDPRRRRGAGVAGGASLFNQFLPLISGLQSYDYSGPRGLAAMLAADEIGPAARHFQRQGELPPGLAGRDELPPGLAGRDELPPGLDNRNPIGGTNVAPGNIDSGQALNQPAGRALGHAQVPHTQGWLNVAPGYAIAAGRGYGTPAYGQGVRQQGPGARGGVRGGGVGGNSKGVGAGAADMQGGDVSTLGGGRHAYGGGGGASRVAPGGPAGGGGGGGGRGPAPKAQPGKGGMIQGGGNRPGQGGKGVGKPGNTNNVNQRVAKTYTSGKAQPVKGKPGSKAEGKQLRANLAVNPTQFFTGQVNVGGGGGQGGKGGNTGSSAGGPPPHRSTSPPPPPKAGKTKPKSTSAQQR